MATVPHIEHRGTEWLNAVHRNISAKYVQVGDLFLPASFEARLDHPEWPALTGAWVTVRVDPERGPVMVGLVVDQPDGTKEVVSHRELSAMLTATIDERSLLQHLTAGAVAWRVLAQDLSPGADTPDWHENMNEDDRAQFSAIMQQAWDGAFEGAAPRRRRTLTPKFLEKVAEVYRGALAEGRPPTAAVADAFAVEHSTASKYVRKARDAQLLGESRQGLAGEGRAKSNRRKA
jgi:hypothetical protein